MGFTPKSTIYRLEFEGELAGLQVKMRAARLGLLFGGSEVAAIRERAVNGEEVTAADEAAVAAEFQQVADHLESWNLEIPEGNPIPATLEGLKLLELPLVLRIFLEWQKAMKDVAPPLPSGSSNGASADLPDLMGIPMQPIPASLAS